MTDRPKFHVITGTEPPDTPTERVRKRVRQTKAGPIAQCHRCGGREVIETKIGVVLKDGKPTGGTKQLLCVACLLNGERVFL